MVVWVGVGVGLGVGADAKQAGLCCMAAGRRLTFVADRQVGRTAAAGLGGNQLSVEVLGIGLEWPGDTAHGEVMVGLVVVRCVLSGAGAEGQSRIVKVLPLWAAPVASVTR